MAASSQEEKDKWLEDLTATIQTAREKGDNKLQYLSLKSCSELICNLVSQPKEKTKIEGVEENI